jgi:hypothetical protein
LSLFNGPPAWHQDGGSYCIGVSCFPTIAPANHDAYFLDTINDNAKKISGLKFACQKIAVFWGIRNYQKWHAICGHEDISCFRPAVTCLVGWSFSLVWALP